MSLMYNRNPGAGKPPLLYPAPLLCLLAGHKRPAALLRIGKDAGLDGFMSGGDGQSDPREAAPVSRTTAARPSGLRLACMFWTQPQSAEDLPGKPAPTGKRSSSSLS